jgi:hypothetical protein
MKRSFPVADADDHVIERNRELREFLLAPYRGVAEKRERARRLRILNVEL